MHFVQIGDNNRAGDYRVIINPGVESAAWWHYYDIAGARADSPRHATHPAPPVRFIVNNALPPLSYSPPGGVMRGVINNSDDKLHCDLQYRSVVKRDDVWIYLLWRNVGQYPSLLLRVQFLVLMTKWVRVRSQQQLGETQCKQRIRNTNVFAIVILTSLARVGLILDR